MRCRDHTPAAHRDALNAGKPGTAGTERRKAPVYPAFLFRCAADWRSALTVQTVTRKGLAGAAHVKGGFKGW